MNLSTEKNLLDKVLDVITKHADKEKLRAESFNVFSVLGFETKEDRTHSAFIAELLDPKGSHLMESLFLDLFLKDLGLSDFISSQEAGVKREFNIGAIDSDRRTGGRIDILITDNTGKTISIENKIYAKDQDHQIERYVNYNKAENKVLYLTLDGSEPSEKSSGPYKSPQDFECISYERDIISWLEECLEKSYKHPILRESIRQYVILLKKLTGQLTDNEMNKDLFKLISENYQAARVIVDGCGQAEQAAAVKLFKTVKNKLEAEIKGSGWSVELDDDLSALDAGLMLYKSGYDDFFTINLVGDRRIWNTHLNYGVFCQDSKKKQEIFDVSRSSDKFANFERKHSDYPVWEWISGANFTKIDDRQKLFNSEAIEKLAEDISGRLVQCKQDITGVLNHKSVFENDI